MNTTLIIGSNSDIGKELIKNCEVEYLIGVDIQLDSETEESDKYFSLYGFEDPNLSNLIKFLEENKLTINKFVYLPGINHMADFYTIEKSQWDKAYAVNIDYFLFLLKELYDFFHQQTSIVCIASQNGVVAHEYRIDYSTSKAALIQLVKNLTVDFSFDKEKDIKINCISPSYILMDKNKDFFNSPFGKKMIDRSPCKKLPIVNDIVSGIIFLLSPQSNAIRGHNLIIDYGYTIV